ncbi:uncharacterized protein NPIL_30511 [Nephila pilipes]|uniref:Uncharacterized protein n=1 Tax=Nephila pilipes TaxID=299642 RepID=A0A8X6TM07_NEPPI|nr:uncharacterized protein NPIL_30511 [Nephila pilipes]
MKFPQSGYILQSMAVIFLHSLLHLTVVKLAMGICHDYEVKKLFKRLSCYLPYPLVPEWEMLIERKASEFGLPHILHNKVIQTVHAMLFDIRKWLPFQFGSMTYEENFVDSLHWKTDGTIDITKTGKSLLQIGDLTDIVRFQIACSFCLEDDIRILWQKLPEWEKECLSTSHTFSVRSHYWIPKLKGDEVKVNSEFIFCCGNPFPNMVQLKFLLNEMEIDERLEALNNVILLTKMDETDMWLCLLQMIIQEQEYFFKKYPYQVLLCLTEWPYLHFFLDAAEHIWPYLSKSAFTEVLRWIKLRCQDMQHFDYNELFEEFWNRSPADFKEYVNSSEELTAYINVATEDDIW